MTTISCEDIRITSELGGIHSRCWKHAGESSVQPPIVLMHDSLGCIAVWREFPEQLCRATGRRVIAYDRIGFGDSDAHPGLLSKEFVTQEPLSGFASVYNAYNLKEFVILGHSVGGGMAIAIASVYQEQCLGLITLSAQTFVEDKTLQGVREAKEYYSDTSKIERLKKYHGDKAQWVLNAWIETWLSPEFLDWNLDGQIFRIRCPALCIHGIDDEFGSLAHPQRIKDGSSFPVSLYAIADCGHVPHREKPDIVLEAILNSI